MDDIAMTMHNAVYFVLINVVEYFEVPNEQVLNDLAAY